MKYRSSSNPEYGEESQGSFKTSVKKITRSSSTSNSYRKNLSRQSTNKRRRNSSRKNVENNKIKQSKLGLQSESESDLETAPIEIKMNNLEHKTHQEEKKTVSYTRASVFDVGNVLSRIISLELFCCEVKENLW